MPEENTYAEYGSPRGERIYLDTIGQEVFLTPNRARALIHELVNWLTDKAQITVNLYGDE